MEKAFIEMDSDADGTVTEAEFVKACLSNRFCVYLFINRVVIFPILSISLLAPGFILTPYSLVDRLHTTKILLENSCKAFFFIGPRSDHSLRMSLTDSLTDSRTC